MTRDEVTRLILTSKHRKQFKWAQLAEPSGQSKERPRSPSWVR